MEKREIALRRAAGIGIGLALILLALLHLLPAPVLLAASGRHVPYRPWNFLSEFVRADPAGGPHAALMTACFYLLAAGTLAAAAWLALRRAPLRREAALLAVAGVALVLLGAFPTDLADLGADGVTCGEPGRIEPCTVVGRVHNPLSTFVFGPILLAVLSVCARSRREAAWRGMARWAAVCGAAAAGGVLGGVLYLRLGVDWQGRWWTGLAQRSLVFPALAWMAGLLLREEREIWKRKRGGPAATLSEDKSAGER